MPKINIPLAIVITVVLAMSGWLVMAQSSKDIKQDSEIKENRETDKKKVDNDTLKLLLQMQEKNFDRTYKEIEQLRKEQRILIEKIK